MKGLVVEKVFQVEESRVSGLGACGGIGKDSSLRQKTQEEDHLEVLGTWNRFALCNVQVETPGGKLIVGLKC